MPAVGFLRLLLAVSVFVSHTKPLLGLRFVGGRLAVEAFFVLSGFYMSLVLHEKYNSPGGTKLFLQNRFLRLYPSYFLISLLALFCAFVVRTDPYETWSLYRLILEPWMVIGIVVSHVLLIGQDILSFVGLNTQTGAIAVAGLQQGDFVSGSSFALIPTAWSLGTELWFYLLAPFVVRRSTRTILLLMLGSLLLRAFLFFVLQWTGEVWSYRFFPTELVFFLAGALAYRLYCQELTRRFPRIGLFVVWLVVIALTVALSNAISQEGVALALYLPIVTLATPFLFQLTKNSRMDRFIGELAYPLYLSHLLFLSINRRWLMNMTEIPLLALTLLFCVLIVFFIESPVFAWRQRRSGKKIRSRAPLIRLMIGLTLLVAGSIWMYDSQKRNNMKEDVLAAQVIRVLDQIEAEDEDAVTGILDGKILTARQMKAILRLSRDDASVTMDRWQARSALLKGLATWEETDK